MRLLREIPLQKKIMYACLLGVLLRYLAITFFIPEKSFSGERMTAVQPQRNTSLISLLCPCAW